MVRAGQQMVATSKEVRAGEIRRVALAFQNGLPHLRFVLRGIVEYARKNGRWLFVNGAASFNFPLASFQNWKGDGIIAHMATPADAEAARSIKIPIVTFVGVLGDPGVPRVSMEHAAIGESAAEHLLVRGFREFAFYGIENSSYSDRRRAAFEHALKEHGITPHSYSSRTTFYEQEKSWDNELASLGKWISTLPKPVGIFAANDQRARILADACVVGNARVPEDVSIVGVDNDEILCEFGSPTLTSVACDWHKLGYETAALLDGLMRGKTPPVKDRVIAPIGVIGRESTTTMVSSDPDVARAIAFANQHSSESFGVESMVRAAGVSRRRLEMAFQESFGCSPMTFLSRFRTEKAKMLLQKKGILLSTVARECGFSDLRHFRQTFTRVAQASPREYLDVIATTYRNKDTIS